VNTARLFLASGNIIQQQYRGQEVKTFTVDKPGPFTNIPLVILVNQSTASAAEILAGGLQGQKRSLLIGTPTYGKDSIQLVFDLGDGSSLHVTAARWWVPGLEPAIRGHGLQPDIAAADDGPQAPLSIAIQTLLSR
jgi:carboxyl-terminal processing protease